MSEDKFRHGTRVKMYFKRSREISASKKKRDVTMEHVSGTGKLEPGSSSGQQAMDADGSSDGGDDDEAARIDELDQWLRRRTAREKSISHCSGHKKCKWSVVVSPGRYVTVDPGPLLVIKKISYILSHAALPPKDAHCQLYLGINRTQAESVIGVLIRGNQNEHQFHLPMNELFTLGHSGFMSVRFSGYTYVPQGQPEPPPSIVRAPPKRRARDPRQWTLPEDLTAKVFNYLSTSEVAKSAERVCPFFGASSRNSFAYSDVDLCDLRYGETLIALMCIRRAGFTIQSLAVGFSYGPDDFDLNRMYSGRFLEPLRYLGVFLKKLKLVGLDLIGPEHLTPVLAVCSVLTNLELHKLVLVPLEYAMHVASAHCKKLQCFEYTSKDADDDDLGVVSEATLQAFLASLPHIKSLGLCGVQLTDSQLLMIMDGLKKLGSLDLSGSRGFIGSFLGGLLNKELVLQVLVLRRSINLQEDQLRVFFTSLGERSSFFPNLKKLVITGFEHAGLLQEGFEGRIDLDALSAARPDMDIVTDFEHQPPAVFDQAAHERFLSDSRDPENDEVPVWNEAHGDWDRQGVQVPDEELDPERYVRVELGGRRRRNVLVYWGRYV